MLRIDEEPCYWRVQAEVVGAGMAGMVKVRIHGWDLTNEPVHLSISEIPGLVRVGSRFLVWAAEDAQGGMHFKDWVAITPEHN